MESYHVAQVNIGKIRAELDDPIMAGFVGRLDEINVLAEGSPGFVWRLKEEQGKGQGNATYLRPFSDERMLLNMSVWKSVEELRHYVYHTAHVELLRERHAWFEKFAGSYTTLWWVPEGHLPGIDEAIKRLEHLEAHGPTQFAFTFKQVFEPEEAFQSKIDWRAFRPCAAN
jgi:uncharacterized protein DUF3291